MYGDVANVTALGSAAELEREVVRDAQFVGDVPTALGLGGLEPKRISTRGAVSHVHTSAPADRIYSGPAMAVVIASNLRKELAGNVLFDGVSFSVERRDRVALSGPNGAGKTTLLRILAGETEKHGGELAFQKGTRVALHDQRPPLEQAMSLREYVLSGARDLVATEEELARLEQAMAGGAHDQATLNRYAEAQARLEHAGGYGWRDHAASVLRGLGFADERSRPSAAHVLGRRADARLARARARRRPRSAPPRRADEPPRRREPRVARARAQLDRRRRDPRRARPLVPRGGDDGDDGDRGRPRDVLPRPVARVAAREGGADAARAEGGRARPERHRAPRALRRAVPREEEQGEAGAGEAHADRPAAGGEGGPRRPDRAALAKTRGLGFEFLKPARSGRTVVEANGVDGRDRRAQRPAPRRDVRDRARRARRARRAERLRQDDAARAARARARPARSGTASRSATSRSRRWSSTRAAPSSSACSR